MNMKGVTLLWGFLLLFLPNSFGQTAALNDLEKKIGNVQADKVSYQQTVKILDQTKGKIEISVTKSEGDKKSSSTSFEFYLSDVDKNTIVSKTSGKIITIELSIQNNLKFIKEYNEGNLKEYSSKMQVIASDPDNSRGIIDLFKALIPQMKHSDLQFGNVKEASDWLSKNISEVKAGNDAYQQVITFDQAKPYLWTYTQTKTDAKGIVTSLSYSLNFDDINKNAVNIAISGNIMKVKMGIKGNQNLIKVLKNNEPQNYENDIEIYFDDLEKARNAINAIQAGISNVKVTYPVYKNKSEAIDKIGTLISTAATGNTQFAQTIKTDGNNSDKITLVINTTESKGKTEENKYEFYDFDLDGNTINVSTSGKDALVNLSIKGKLKYFKVLKNNVLQNYDDQIAIHAADIETARLVADGIKNILSKSEFKSPNFKSANEAITFIKEGIINISAGTNQLNQSIENSGNEPLFVTYKMEKTENKGSSLTETYGFYPYLIDLKMSKISISGKSVILELKSKDKGKFFKYTKNGEIQNYTNEMEIQFSDILKVREVLAAFTSLVEKTAPKSKSWTNKSDAASFILNSVKDITNGKNQVKQKLELVGGDPSKINYNRTSIDEKGTSKEEIFEFSMVDINKKKCQLMDDGKVLVLKLESKKQDKLIKYYKDSKLQNYVSSIEFVFEDFDQARNVMEAFVYLAEESEK